jgi:hypothetical protein
MFDNEIAEVLRKTYGDEQFKIYCEMQVVRNKLAADELNRLNDCYNDVGYERYFWQEKLDEITRNENLKKNG